MWWGVGGGGEEMKPKFRGSGPPGTGPIDGSPALMRSHLRTRGGYGGKGGEGGREEEREGGREGERKREREGGRDEWRNRGRMGREMEEYSDG